MRLGWDVRAGVERTAALLAGHLTSGHWQGEVGVWAEVNARMGRRNISDFIAALYIRVP